MNDIAAGPMTGRHQPERASVVGDERLTVLDHPLCSHLLGVVRDSRQPAGPFGEAARMLAMMLLIEASRDLKTQPGLVPGFDGSPVNVQQVADPPAGVSILRAGEVFSEPFRRMFPSAPLFHLGIRRDEKTLEHDVYSDTVGDHIDAGRVLILDPMLATGGSVRIAIERVRRGYSGPVDVLSLVAAPVGVRVVLDADPNLRVITGALDDHLNEQGFIVPGLGDAGDRFFGTTGPVVAP